MINKKILIFASVFFLVILLGNIGADFSVKKDWLGNPFNWGYGINGVYYNGDKTQLSALFSCDQQSEVGNWAYYVNNIGGSWKWYYVKCHNPAGESGGVHWASSHIGSGDYTGHWTYKNEAYASCTDGDNDGFAPAIGQGTICGDFDCDDGDGNKFPGNPEICDGKDNNCNGYIDGANENSYSTGTEICDGHDNTCDGNYMTNENSYSTGTESCTDGSDNDCDGLIDCADSNCDGQTACLTVTTVTLAIPCTDADNDNYCAESSGANCISTNICAYFGDCLDTTFPNGVNIHPGATEICNDNIDNDCDTKRDCADINCNNLQGSGGRCEYNSETTCNDGFDNDRDGLIDENDSDCNRIYWANDDQGLNKITQTSAIPNAKIYLIYNLNANFYPAPNFEIWEKDSSGGDDEIRTNNLGNALISTSQGGKRIVKWTISQADITRALTEDPNNLFTFYFKFVVPTNPQMVWATSPILDLEWQTGPPCTNENTQSCYTGSSGTEGAGECKSGTQTCSASSWGTCIGQTIPTTEICGDGKDNDCDGIGETSEETDCQTTPVDCAQYNLCSQITNPTNCDSCQVSTLDECEWNSVTTSCNPYEDQEDDDGNNIRCVYEENTDDDCNDGRLDYLLELIPGSHVDCDTKPPVQIFCSAQTSLPLENKFGILLTIISIIGIYFVFFRKKNE